MRPGTRRNRLSSARRGRRRALGSNRTARYVAAAAVLAGVTAAHFAAAHYALDAQARLARRAESRRAVLLVRHLGQAAALPLLSDDAPALAALVRRIPAEDGYLSAAVVDRDGVVRAHTDPENVGRRYAPPAGTSPGPGKEGAEAGIYVRASGERVLYATAPVEVRGRTVGSVHAWFSASSAASGPAADALRRAFAVSWAAAAGGVGIAAAAGLLLRRRGAPASAPTGAAVFRLKDLPRRGTAPADGGAAGGASIAGSVVRKALSLARAQDAPADGVGGGPPGGRRLARGQATILSASVRPHRGSGGEGAAEELLADLPRYLETAGRVVEAHGGRIDRVAGEAFAAVFGGGDFLPDHTMRAVEAAFAMQKAFRDAGGDDASLWRRVGIGIASGVVLVCDAPGGSRSAAITIGDCFRAAGALSVLAGPGEIVIGREVYESLGGAVSVEPLPPRETLDRTGSWENFRLQDDFRKGA